MLSSEDTFQLIIAAYEHQLSEHGPTPSGVLWSDEKGQIERFETLCAIIDDESKNSTIIDYGCGYGAFFRFLRDKPYMSEGRYFGYDICPSMIDSAKQSFDCDPRACFEVSAIASAKADYSFASGTFNMKATESNVKWAIFIKESIYNLSEASKLGIGFNLLSCKNIEQEWLYYADPDEFYKFCTINFSGKTEIIFNKAKTEFTLLVKL